jgi:hypothetical protein
MYKQTMIPDLYRIALHHRLLIVQFSHSHTCHRIGWRQVMDPHGYHALSCIRGAGNNGTYTSHNGIASNVVDLGESAGVKGILNAKDVSLPGQIA